jgi:hypothetical protein
MKVFREYGDPACHHCSKNLNLTARKGKKGKKGGKGGKGEQGKQGRISAQYRVAK